METAYKNRLDYKWARFLNKTEIRDAQANNITQQLKKLEVKIAKMLEEMQKNQTAMAQLF